MPSLLSRSLFWSCIHFNFPHEPLPLNVVDDIIGYSNNLPKTLTTVAAPGTPNNGAESPERLGEKSCCNYEIGGDLTLRFSPFTVHKSAVQVNTLLFLADVNYLMHYRPLSGSLASQSLETLPGGCRRQRLRDRKAIVSTYCRPTVMYPFDHISSPSSHSHTMYSTLGC